MRVALDSQGIRLERQGGVSRYIVSLARALLRERIDVRIVAPVHRNAYLREASAIPLVGRYVHEPIVHRRVDELLNRLVEPVALRMVRPDVLHATFYRRLDSGGARIRVLTVHDMIHERFVHWHPHDPMMAMKARAVAQADHVICISRSTRDDLCEILGVPQEKTSVVYHGGSRLLPPESLPVRRRPYVLYVGQRHRHKNFPVLLEAFGTSSHLRANYDIVAFGGQPFNDEEFALARRSGIGDGGLVRVVGGDDVLAGHYAAAAALVYPSLYEGFGIPLIEAMALGCPVVTSGASCMPEIGADAALYFDPGDAAELAYALERITTDPALRNELIDKGRRREAMFSWERCARETRSVYEAALQRR